MKKIVVLIVLTICVVTGFAQHYETIRVEDLTDGSSIHYCADDVIGVIIYGEENCDTNVYVISDHDPVENMDSIVLPPETCTFSYYGCDLCVIQAHLIASYSWFVYPFIDSVLLKRQYEPITLEMFYTYYDEYLWSTGETTESITVTDPGIYSVTVSTICGSATYSVEVRDNVELYRATVDLRTNKNKVTWLATPEQAEYITDVKIYRDGTLVGTAPYTSGYFLDAIGSDAAARTYQIVGVSKEGDDCPIPSYQKGTIHTTYYQDVNNDLNMTWNIPYVEEGAQGQLTGFEIYKYSLATEELTLIDAVNASITDYTCNANAFIGGQATIAAVFSSKDMESRSFSNLNTVLAVDENEGNNFKIYPNPANGRFTVEGIGMMHISNVLGQEIMAKEIEGVETVELPQGLYFVKLNDTVRKIVVE